jgi:hypothetical protein
VERKLKHLEMLQAVIARLAGNSFLLKGWSVTLVSALLALAAKDADRRFVLVAFIPSIMFWILDAYFLRQERLFRGLYGLVCAKEPAEIDFSMDTGKAEVLGAVKPWRRVMFSQTLLVFHGTILLAILAVAVWLR